MGNCLPLLFGHRNLNNESSGQHSLSSRSNSGASGDTSMSFTNPVMQLPHSSAYVNQLYTANLARQRAAAGESKEMEDAQRIRVKGLLEQIPADVFRQDMKSCECQICMNDFEDGESIRFLPCMHFFHVECVDDWLMRSFICPSCTEPVDSTILSSLTAHTQQSFRDLTFSPNGPISPPQ